MQCVSLFYHLVFFQSLLPLISCHAFKLGMGSEQDAQCSEQDAHTTTRISSLLILRFKISPMRVSLSPIRVYLLTSKNDIFTQNSQLKLYYFVNEIQCLFFETIK